VIAAGDVLQESGAVHPRLNIFFGNGFFDGDLIKNFDKLTTKVRNLVWEAAGRKSIVNEKGSKDDYGRVAIVAEYPYKSAHPDFVQQPS
jgi:hypothetical protein